MDITNNQMLEQEIADAAASPAFIHLRRWLIAEPDDMQAAVIARSITDDLYAILVDGIISKPGRSVSYVSREDG